jgi:hypothetical protein
VTIILGLVSTVLAVLRRQRHPGESTQDPSLFTLKGIKSKPLLFTSSLLAQTVLVLSSFAIVYGVDDFTSLFLCVFDGAISASRWVTLTFTVVSVWNGVVGVMVLEAWLLWWLRRAQKRREEREKSVSVYMGIIGGGSRTQLVQKDGGKSVHDQAAWI